MDLPQKLIFNLGDIYFIKNYEFEDGGTPTDKLLIVLHKGENKDVMYLTFTLTTSQLDNAGITGIYRNDGCTVLTESPKLHFFFFKQGKIVGIDNFSFDTDTVIIFQNNIRYRPLEHFEKYSHSNHSLDYKGTFNDEILNEIIECALNSKHIPGKLESKLKESQLIIKDRLIDETAGASAADKY